MSKPADDAYFMRLALRQAALAGSRGEVPIGAVVVSEGVVVARGANASISRNDPTAHAEILALRKAARKSGNYRLNTCDMYVTLEPCAMCLGAIVQARIRRLIYGAEDPKSGSVHSIMEFPFDRLNHRPEVKAGILDEECGRIIRGFFRGKRTSR